MAHASNPFRTSNPDTTGPTSSYRYSPDFQVRKSDPHYTQQDSYNPWLVDQKPTNSMNDGAYGVTDPTSRRSAPQPLYSHQQNFDREEYYTAQPPPPPPPQYSQHTMQNNQLLAPVVEAQDVHRNRRASNSSTHSRDHSTQSQEQAWSGGSDAMNRASVGRQPYANGFGPDNGLLRPNSGLERRQSTQSDISIESVPPQPEDQEAVAEMLAWIPSRQRLPKEQMPSLQKPVAIPQIDVGRLGGQMPFVRAYSPALASHDIQPTDFVAFIDNLTVAQAPPPPLQALNIVGAGMGFVPHHWAHLASQGIGLASGLGSAIVSKTRTKLFMERVNREYFGPRGLKASLCKHDEISNTVRFPDTIPILAPLDATTKSFTIVERRLHALAPYISPLTLDVPPPVAQKNALDKITAKQVNANIAKNQKKILKDRTKHLARSGFADPPTNSSMPPKSDAYETSRQVSRTSDDSESVGFDEEEDYGRQLRVLQMKMQQINMRAEEASFSTTRLEQLDAIELQRRREILAVQKEKEMLEFGGWKPRISAPTAASGTENLATEKSKKELKKEKREHQKQEKEEKKQGKKAEREGKQKDESKARKSEEKEVKAAMKLNWLVIENL